MFNLDEENYGKQVTAVPTVLGEDALKLKLNSDQILTYQTVVENLIQKQGVGRLVGYAGVGKTFIMQALAEEYG